MEKRRFGKSDIAVSVLGYGAMELGRCTDAEADGILNMALDEGINFIDSSPCYDNSEKLIGKSVSRRRDEYILASKCGCPVDPGGAHEYTIPLFQTNLENSLRLMKTDYLDLLQIHMARPEDFDKGPASDILVWMDKMKEKGLIRLAGISFKNGPGSDDPLFPAGYSLEGIKEYLDWGVFDVIQLVYGAFVPDCHQAIDDLKAFGIGVIARGLVKNYFGDHRERYETSGIGTMPEIEGYHDFLIRYALSHPGLSTAIVGTADKNHLKQNIEAARKGGYVSEVFEAFNNRLQNLPASVLQGERK